jgi:hypothetical protein
MTRRYSLQERHCKPTLCSERKSTGAIIAKSGAPTVWLGTEEPRKDGPPAAGVGEANGSGERPSFAGAVLLAEKRRRCQRTEQA